MSEEKRRREHKARVLAEHVEGWFWVDGPHVRLGGEERGEVLSPDEVVTLRDGLNDLLREMGVEE